MLTVEYTLAMDSYLSIYICLLPGSEVRRMAATLGELSMHHPVLSILRVEQALEQNEQLKAYILFLISSHQEVPATMTELYGGYVNYIMKRNTQVTNTKNEQQTDPTEIFTKFGRAAFDGMVKKRKLTREVLEKQYQMSLPDCSSSSESVGNEANRSTETVGDPGSFPGTYGFIVRDESTKKGTLKFRDTVVRDYLAAHYQLSEVLRKIKSERKKLLSSNLIESVRRLPATGDLWRITLGLMVKSTETRKKQRPLMVELLDYSKTLITMSSFDMTSLCVESIYESRLASTISRKTLDDFTLNQTINFSNVKLKPHRLSYSIGAVGHLVRTNGEVFGLHLANFGINESNIHLLADPLNVISDNSLQVLNLSGNELGEAGIIKLERFLVKASLLTHLDLSGCLLFDAGAIALSDFLICLQLIYLNLNNNGITDMGMEKVIANLRFCPALEFLHVAGNRLTDKSAVRLGQVIKGLPRLRSLDLRRNQIGEDGVKSVSANSKNLKPLTEAERKRSSVRSITVWKTRSARISNFSLRKVPMAGVMKRSNQSAAATDGSACNDGAKSLPDVIEEKSEEEEEEKKSGEEEAPKVKKETRRLKARSMHRLKQIDQAKVKRKFSAPANLFGH